MNSEVANTEEVEVTREDVGVCNYEGNEIKAYMDYRTITDANSIQYQIVNSAYIDNGLLYYEDCICVALGSYYGPVGTKYLVTFDDGKQVQVIKADAKSDAHTTNGCYNFNGSILEIINDKYTTDGYVMQMGDFNVDQRLSGTIAKIEKI